MPAMKVTNNNDGNAHEPLNSTKYNSNNIRPTGYH